MDFLSHESILLSHSVVISQNGLPIRLTYKQWSHITENHDYMAGCIDMVLETIAEPDLIVKGWTDELIALKHYPKTVISRKDAIVISKERWICHNCFFDILLRKNYQARHPMAAVNLLKSIPCLLTAPSSRIWIDYDEEADVLYISFRKLQRANDSLLEDNIIYHYRDRDLVGLTVLKASDFNSGDSENKINGSENPEMG